MYLNLLFKRFPFEGISNIFPEFTHVLNEIRLIFQPVCPKKRLLKSKKRHLISFELFMKRRRLTYALVYYLHVKFREKKLTSIFIFVYLCIQDLLPRYNLSSRNSFKCEIIVKICDLVSKETEGLG